MTINSHGTISILPSAGVFHSRTASPLSKDCSKQKVSQPRSRENGLAT